MLRAASPMSISISSVKSHPGPALGCCGRWDALCLVFGAWSEVIGTRAGCASFLKDQQRERNAFRVLLACASVKQESKDEGCLLFSFLTVKVVKVMAKM